LRSDLFVIVVDAIREAHREDGRVTHFTVEPDHVHLIGEADDGKALARLMLRIKVRMARRLNKALGRSGPVFGDRYHIEVLGSPRQVHHALTYALNNHRKHVWQRWGREIPATWVDPYSSGPWFDGWDMLPDYFWFNAPGPNPTEPPRSWLLRTGWMRHGPIRLTAVPGRSAKATRGRRATPRLRPSGSASGTGG
jgi:REP element-mobilizing transposase RayT